ncbi:methyltransferase domain-containing protein [Erwinia sp. CPCC 100877]|nr:methyltransferase domain-containing protein [Erwinia sp. CPCC 100877]
MTKQMEYDRYLSLWEKHSALSIVHEKHFWNEKAAEWADFIEQKDQRFQLMQERIEATAVYLKQRGVLTETTECLDLGCGPAQFAYYFAQTARSVTAADFSEAMLAFGQRYCEARACANVEFTLCDFRTADLAQFRWEKRFDLVFCSMTPAIRMPGLLEKLMAASKGYCFTSCVLSKQHSLLDALTSHFQDELEKKSDTQYFYALFNLLLLRGFLPETYYHQQTTQKEQFLTEKMANEYAQVLFGKKCQPAQTTQVYNYLTELFPDGRCTITETTTYGWLLWKVAEQKITF